LRTNKYKWPEEKSAEVGKSGQNKDKSKQAQLNNVGNQTKYESMGNEMNALKKKILFKKIRNKSMTFRKETFISISHSEKENVHRNIQVFKSMQQFISDWKIT